MFYYTYNKNTPSTMYPLDCIISSRFFKQPYIHIASIYSLYNELYILINFLKLLSIVLSEKKNSELTTTRTPFVEQCLQLFMQK